MKQIFITDTEQTIIDEFLKLKEQDAKSITFDARNTINILLKKITEEIESFNDVNEDFINHSAIQDYFLKLNHSRDDESKFFALWLHIAGYLKNKSEIKLELIENLLKYHLQKTITPEKKAGGMALLPINLANQMMIKKIFLAEDEKLSCLFLKYLPAPRAHIFKGHTLPKILAARERDSVSVIKELMDKKLEPQSIKIQRQFRKKQRMKEEEQRIAGKLKQYGYRDTEIVEEVKKIIVDANTQYLPECEAKLSQRLVTAAGKVKLFSSVKHLTAANALENIFNDCLYGRRTLLNFYMFFRPASLYPLDVAQGDGNVICLGAKNIDPQANHGIELEFDLEKISKDNPCIFYKQRDFGFDPQEKYRVQIGDLSLLFSHTRQYRRQPPETSAFILYANNGAEISHSSILTESLIAYNTKEMQQILTLNFFRFIDRLHQPTDHQDDKVNRKEIYDALQKLNNEELVEVLQKIGTHMIDTMEFNIYGAYKIDFEALKTVKMSKSTKFKKDYTLELKSFIAELKEGKLERLKEAVGEIPQIFNSYRFIDYLLSKTENELAIDTLQSIRKKCTLPGWLEEEKSFRPR